jgi:hypothetical protein
LIRSTFASVVLAPVILASVLVAPAAARKNPPCPDGRFLVTQGGPLVVGAQTPSQPDAVTVSGRTLSIDSGCEARRGVVQGGRKATRLAGAWGRCGDLRKVRLKGRIAAPDCSTLTGTVKVKGQKRPVPFTAVRSYCGDGRADLVGGEACDIGGCGAGTTCAPDCTCVPMTPTTTTTTPGATTTTSTTLPLLSGDPTWDALRAAAAAIAAGDDEVALTPDGTTWTYVRTRSNGEIVGEALRHEGAVVLQWSHAGNETQGAADANRDGVFERRWHVVRTAADAAISIVTDDPEDDGSPIRRVTYTIAGTALGVVVEENHGHGLEEVEAFDTTTIQTNAGPGGVTPLAADCTPTQQQQLEAQFKQAWEQGKQCFRDLGLDQTLNFLIWKLGTDGIAIRCGELAGDNCAEIDISDSLFFGALPLSVGVTIDPNNFFNSPICLANQLNVLWHEVLHVAHGPHAPGFNATNDETYACTALCFNKTGRPNAPAATKCQCATCLDTDPCDPRCAAYADCGQDCSLVVTMDQAVCNTTACGPCGAAPGRIDTQVATGSVKGPVGTVLQVNAPKGLGGRIECPNWTPSPCPTSDLLVCCKRESADQPEATTYAASFDLPTGGFCNCGGPSALSHNFVAQAIGATGVEVEKTATPCL